MKQTLKAKAGILAVLTLLVSAAAAQEKPAPPKDPRVVNPAEPIKPEGAKPGEEAVTPAPTASADRKPLLGTESFSLGILADGRSFLNGNLSVSLQGDSNINSLAGTGVNWHFGSAFGGNISLQKIWGQNANLNVNYSGGGRIYDTNQSGANGIFQRLTFSTGFMVRRFQITVNDSFSYSPESNGSIGGIGGGSFGGVFGGGLGGSIPGSGFSGLGTGGSFLLPGTLPNQTILAGQDKRWSNTIGGSVNYALSPRNSLTFAGSYGMLRFIDGNFIDSNSFQGQAGFSRQLNAADSLGFSYGVSLVRFVGVSDKIDSHSFRLNYGRRITGRTAIQLFVGPQVSLFSNPNSGSDTRVNWAMSASVLHNFGRMNANIRYFHGITGGSGVFIGAQTDRVQVGLSRTFGRYWSASFGGGFARNENLQQTSLLPLQRHFYAFDANAHIGHPIGRHGSISLFYTFTRQTTNFNFCTPGTLSCGNLTYRHNIGLNFAWGFGPINLE